MSAGSPDPVREQALAVGRTPAFRWSVRGGFLARALTYGLIGAIALALAFGAGRPASPDQQGALTLVAHAPLGRLAMIIVAIGLLAYAVWKLGQAVLGHGPDGGGGPSLKDRVANLAAGLCYLAFFALAVRVLLGSSGNAAGQQRSAAAGVLGWPGGRLIIGAAGITLVGVSLYQAYEAVSDRFVEDNRVGEMQPSERRLFLWLGRVGLVARAFVFAVVGYFLLRTAIDFDPNKAIGVDGALAEVHHQPLGQLLLALVAAGLLVFAAFSLLEARYRKL